MVAEVVSRKLDPQAVHETVVQLIGQFAEVMTVDRWMTEQNSGNAMQVR